eukprot:2765987-Amphidinium_carterae.2
MGRQKQPFKLYRGVAEEKGFVYEGESENLARKPIEFLERQGRNQAPPESPRGEQRPKEAQEEEDEEEEEEDQPAQDAEGAEEETTYLRICLHGSVSCTMST